MHSPAADLVRVEGLVKHFRGIAAIDGLSLTLGTGESLGLTGGNGSGKTTFIDIVTGFTKPERGRIWLGGQDVTGWPPHRIVRAGIARTFQPPRIAPRLTVEQTLEAAALHRRLPRQRRSREVDRVLGLLGLGGLRKREAWELSAAQIGRLEIARALATEPRALLLDEPFASLGADDAAAVLSALRHLRSQRLAMLLVAHSGALLKGLCDRVAVMEGGRVSRVPRPGDLRHA